MTTRRNACIAFAFGLLLASVSWCAVGQVQPVPVDPEVKRILSSVVGVAAFVPEKSRTAEALGLTRRGSGVVVGENLVLTIGYIILEANRVYVFAEEDEPVEATVLGYDAHSGLGLVKTVENLDTPVIALGDSDSLGQMSPALVASFASPRIVSPTIVVAREDFAGYWEYLIENAITTTPPYRGYAGAALLGPSGELLGIGSLQVMLGEGNGANLFVPINAILPIFDELVATGTLKRPARPWLGAYATERDGAVVIIQVAEDSPAYRADLIAGDQIVAVAGKEVHSLKEYFRALWALGEAGVGVPLTIEGVSGRFDVTVVSMDRQVWLDTAAE